MPVFDSKEQYQVLMGTLRTLGVTRAIVNFSGGGDSGSVEDIDFENSQNQPLDIGKHKLSWGETYDNFDPVTNRWTTVTDAGEMRSLDSILTGICEKALEISGLDWYNNEGGTGYLEILFLDDYPDIRLHVGIYETVSRPYQYKVGDCFELEEV